MATAGSGAWESRPVKWCPPADSRHRRRPWSHHRRRRRQDRPVRLPCRQTRPQRRLHPSAALRPAVDGDFSDRLATDGWPPPSCRWRSDAPIHPPTDRTSAAFLWRPSSPRWLFWKCQNINGENVRLTMDRVYLVRIQLYMQALFQFPVKHTRRNT